MKRIDGKTVLNSELALIMLFFSSILFANSATNNVYIVENGKAKSVIVLAESDAKALEPDVKLLVRCIEKSTGATIPVKKSPTDTNLIEIHIGNTDYVRTTDINLTNLDKDSFCIAFPSVNRIVILGKSEWGLRYGIFEFLERYVGVRWLFPGELGEYIPKRDAVRVERNTIKQEPAFWSRTLSWSELPGTPIDEWTRKLRMHRRIEFHHNMWDLLPPSKYYKEHSDWYPTINGEKVCPATEGSDSETTWQPIFDAPGIVEESVKNINQFFENNPDIDSFSLGINDSDNFGKPSGNLNSQGFTDLSDYYYGWASKVASRVLDRYPDKMFGCLAYLNVADPPKNVKMNSRIVPFTTFDRMEWFDKKAAEKDKKRTIEWSKAARQVGWYDYIYGDMSYKVPRIYWHLQSAYLKFAYTNNVRAVYAEAYPSQEWTEGPKFYLYLKLLWNPNIDVNETLKEWCICAVGEDATPYLKQYYDFWEQFWQKRVVNSRWFKIGVRDTWLPYSEDGYLEGLKKNDIENCQNLLNKVVEKAKTDEEKARAAFFVKGFDKIKNGIGNLSETTETLSKLKCEEFKRFDFTPLESQVSNLPEGWTFWSRLSNYKKVWWDKNAGHSNAGSLAIDVNDFKGHKATNISCFTTDIAVEPSKPYRISCWVKVNKFSKNGTVGLVAKWKDKDIGWIEKYQNIEEYEDNPSDNSWEKLSINFIVPPIQKPLVSVQLVINNAENGIVFFDDVLIEKLQLSQGFEK